MTFPPLTCGDKRCKTGDPRAIDYCAHCTRMIRDREVYGRAASIAVAAGEPVQNAELRVAQEQAWRKFVLHVWGGFPRPTESEPT